MFLTSTIKNERQLKLWDDPGYIPLKLRQTNTMNIDELGGTHSHCLSEKYWQCISTLYRNAPPICNAVLADF